MLNKINEIIATVNYIICNIKNIQKYVGTKNETDTSTITGRLTKLEHKVCDTWLGEEWLGCEWPAEDNNQQINVKEW